MTLSDFVRANDLTWTEAQPKLKAAGIETTRNTYTTLRCNIRAGRRPVTGKPRGRPRKPLVASPRSFDAKIEALTEKLVADLRVIVREQVKAALGAI